MIFNYLGFGRLLKGPARVFLFRERLQRLTHYTASAHEYLRIMDNDGYVTHKQGPCEMFHNPLEHRSIQVLPADVTDANHVFVVYKKLKDNSVERRIVCGPTIFMPQAEEWLHEFKWHGPDPNEIGRMIPQKDVFTKMLIVPSRFYYNVRDVRTVDDTMLSVKLIIFYEFVDVLKMLENTHDPISDMINAVCADVIGFAGRQKLNDFLKNAPSLNDVDVYPQLMQRAMNTGIHISKVVYRGYHADSKLQQLQDRTIESRTRMRVESELHEQELRLKDYKLNMEQDRLKLQQDVQQCKLEHSQKMEAIKKSHDLQLIRLVHDANVEKASAETKLNLEMDMLAKKKELSHFSDLKKLNVDLTQYLIQEQAPPVNEEFRVTQGSSSF